jgi:hypothetical protein
VGLNLGKVETQDETNQNAKIMKNKLKRGFRMHQAECEASRPLSNVFVINDNYMWTNGFLEK